MANYPSLPQATDSQEEWIDPVQVDYSRAGGAKARRLQTGKKRRFVVKHRYLTAAQMSTLESFYDSNRDVTLTFAWADSPATTYTVIFADEQPLQFTRTEGNYYDVTVTLAEA